MESRRLAEKPVLYWDADCEFCRRWVERWRHSSGDAVEYRTLQTSPSQVAEAAGGEPFQRIVLVEPDGTLRAGAHAALASLGAARRHGGIGLALYRSFPPFRHLSEAAYRWVAAHRAFCAKLTTLLWGPKTLVSDYNISGFLFPRSIGLIFFFAFVSLWVQIDGLAGSQGILPVAGHLASVKSHYDGLGQPWNAWLQIPSLLWLGSDDQMLHLWLGAGAIFSLLLLLGILPALSAFVAWLCYLSFAAAVPVFLNFQWDALLLEAGLLTVFYVPWTRYLRTGASAPSCLGRLLVWWLLFRLMFESGVVKLYGFDTTGRNAWLDGTALDYHYFTQPIPVWTSWWIAHLPDWFHRFSLGCVFLVELVLPFCLWGPRRLRMSAFWGFSLLMLLIMCSGHYGFFNLLALALCITLVDDACWPAWARKCLSRRQESQRVLSAGGSNIRNRILPWFAGLVLLLTGLQLLLVLRLGVPPWALRAAQPFLPLRSANSYGLFSVMTTERPEITIEASENGVNWQPYRFRYTMAPADNTLPFLLPHMPRLDWQMWFAALEYRGSRQPPAWIMPLLSRLQQNSTAVLGLLDGAQATPPTPAFFRLRLDLLTFTSPDEKAVSGNYWSAQLLPDYTIQGALRTQTPEGR